MATDYLKDDEALDDEIRTMYGLSKDDDASEESEEQESQESPDEGTVIENEQDDEQDAQGNELEQDQHTEPPTEPTVAESRYKNAVAEMHRAQNEVDRLRKSDAQRDTLIQQLQEQVQALQESNQQTTAPAQVSNSIDEDDLKEARELYPEVVDPLFKIIKGLQDELKGIKGEVGNVKTVADKYQQQAQQSEADKHWATIFNSHPDVQEIAQSPEYASWYEGQPPSIKQALASGTAEDVVAALDRYRVYYPKEAVTEAPKTNITNIKSNVDKLAEAKKAATPTVNGLKPKTDKIKWTREKIAEISKDRDQFKRYEQEIDDAMRNGEVA